ncbi:MAG: hypothetical protein ACYSSI_00210 [Planctomycetota bacterium]|jgi:hypothetical protein
MEHLNEEMIKRIQQDYLEPDKLLCHLGWYRQQTRCWNAFEEGGLVDKLVEACMDMASVLNGLHLGTVIGMTKLEIAEAAEKKGREALAEAEKGK